MKKSSAPNSSARSKQDASPPSTAWPGSGIAALIGRIGPQAAIVLRSRKAGPMADRRTRRNRTRAAQNNRAIDEG